MLAPPTGGRLPMAGSVNPKVGPNWLVVGDAAGSINPFNGEGIDYAYETARMAADLLDEALVTGTGTPLQRYPALLDDEYGLYFKVARHFAKIIGQPVLMRELTRVGMRSHSLMEWVLRIMANLLRDDELGPAEAAYRSVARLARHSARAGARLSARRSPSVGGATVDGSSRRPSPAHSTVSVACIDGWISQWNGYSPGSVGDRRPPPSRRRGPPRRSRRRRP